MADPVYTKDITEWVDTKTTYIAEKAAEETRLSPLDGTVFETMTQAEKDILLKELAIKAGLLAPDGKVNVVKEPLAMPGPK